MTDLCETLRYVFIIPYRDRIEHKTFFDYYMKFILEDYDPMSYLIIYAQQNDNRPFNRGAMKNIGFRFIKDKLPNHYKDIIFIFNDVDSVPYTKGLLDYDVLPNEVKHFYGYDFALGGIFSIRGSDFEKTNGFPNYWSWGYEDNVMQKRVLNCGMNINRSTFYDIFSKKILHFCDDFRKLISARNHRNLSNPKYVERDGLNTLTNVRYDFDGLSILYVDDFNALYEENETDFIPHTLLQGKKVAKAGDSSYEMSLFKKLGKNLI